MKMYNEKSYCICEESNETYMLENDFGIWHVCRNCGKAINESFEYFERK